jgi:hypothetical protein
MKWMARYSPKPFYPRNLSARKLGGLQNGSERCQNGNISYSHLEWNPKFLGPRVRTFVSVMTKLLRMYYSRRCKSRIFTAKEAPDLVVTSIKRMRRGLRRKWWWPVLKRQPVTFHINWVWLEITKTANNLPNLFEFKMHFFSQFSELKTRVCLKFDVLFSILRKPQNTIFPEEQTASLKKKK